MREFGSLLYILGGVSCAVLILTLLWEVAARLFNRGEDSLPFEKEEPLDWDPFQHLGEVNQAESESLPDPVPPIPPKGPGVARAPLESAAKEPASGGDDPWKSLLWSQTEKTPKPLREIEFDSQSTEEGDKI